MVMADLFTQNLIAFEKAGLCDLSAKLRSMGEMPISLVGSMETGDLNINLGNTNLYTNNALDYANGQVEQYLRSPNRFCINPPALDSPYVGLERELYKNLLDRFPTDKQQPDGNDAGYLISFGLGLGLHINKLLQNISVQDIVIVEQFWEFVALSLQATDWQPILDYVNERGSEIHFIIGTDSGQLSNSIFKKLRGKQFGLIDGSFGIQHYNSPLLTDTHKLFREMLPTLGMSAGFFADECLMLQNTIANFNNPSVKQFKNHNDLLNDTPVFVVGSGPSIDGAIYMIKKHAKDAIVISSGTALGVLIKAGIKPDYHCELENVTDIYDALVRIGGPEDFNDIHLIASNTVDPRVLDLFNSNICFFRDSLTATSLFAKEEDILYLAGPTVSNLACRSAIALGAKEIYLFGVDLGSVDPEKHHSENSTYFASDDNYWQEGAGIDRFDKKVKGNFRDQVFTNGPFLLTRTFFNELISAFPDVNFYNCSDGANLEGAIPTLPIRLNIKPADTDVKSTLTSYFNQLNTANQNYDVSILDDYKSALDAWYKKIISYIEKDSEYIDFKDIYNKSQNYLVKIEGRTNIEQAAVMCNSGTVMMMMQFGYAYSRRVGSADQQNFIKLFVSELEKVLNVMKNDILPKLDNYQA